MATAATDPLVAWGIRLYQSFPPTSSPAEGEKAHEAWLTYVKAVTASVASGALEPSSKSAIASIATNVYKSALALSTMETDLDRELVAIADKVNGLNLDNFISHRKRRSNHDDSNHCRTSKRNCRPTTTKYLPTPSPLPPAKSLKSISRSSSTANLASLTTSTPPDPVRQYFLTHLAFPYPTPTEKEKLCKKAKITRRKLESDLTNWRRRSDWTDIMNTYCGGDKSAMRIMVGAIERGEERDVELLERFGRMRAYLEKRDEQAGEWVIKLAEMVESGRLDELQSFNENDDDNYSDNNSNPDSDSEDDEPHPRPRYESREEDAEGETESESQSQAGYRPAPVTPLKEIGQYPRYTKEVDSPYTTVPLNMTIPVPTANSTTNLDSPLTDLSPISSVESHISLIPSSTYFTQGPKVQQASTKSSYSSLSAASNAAGGARKRNISDSSTSSNLRSASGSSTSSFHPVDEKGKRPAKESFSRSSRSRVEDILSDHSTQPSWVAGHGPNQGFHIGADPRFIPQSQHMNQHHNQDLNQAPPPYEMGPYLMTPDAWTTNNGHGWSPLPHTNINHGRGGEEGFRMPSEYDFTFGHGQEYEYGYNHVQRGQ